MADRPPRAALTAVPAAERPDLDGYGITDGAAGLLPWSWADEQLQNSRNYWICTTRPDGRPHAMPVWGAWTGEAILFGTNPTSVKARNLEGHPAVTVHLESGDDAVILEGEAERLDLNAPAGRAAFALLCAAFETKYDWRPGTDDPEMALFRVAPVRAYGWRETSFTSSATRWRFDRSATSAARATADRR